MGALLFLTLGLAVGAGLLSRAEAAGKVVRHLHEQGNPTHRLRVEHDSRTLLIHLSGEDGDGWTTIASDRATRTWAVAQGARQTDTARAAHDDPYGAWVPADR